MAQVFPNPRRRFGLVGRLRPRTAEDGVERAAGARETGSEMPVPCLGQRWCYNRTMHWFARLVIIVGGNALALWVANTYVSGFVLNGNWVTIMLIALVLAILNFLLKPILTLILGPVIILTLGLGVLVVNAIILWILPIIADHIDFLHGSIIIQNIPALFFATLVVSVINFIIHVAL
jgi:putative membrane protein